MKAFITIGIPASGKSGWSRDYVREYPNTLKIDRDDFRFALTSAANWDEYDFDEVTEQMITAACDRMIEVAAENNKDIILCETHLQKKDRDRAVRVLRSAGYGDIEFREFPIDFAEAVDRDFKRTYTVGIEVMKRHYNRWLQYLEEKQ